MMLCWLTASTVFAVLAALLAPANVRGSALTTTISAHERSCFYAWVDKAGEKVGFYFAVSGIRDNRAAVRFCLN